MMHFFLYTIIKSRIKNKKEYNNYYDTVYIVYNKLRITFFKKEYNKYYNAIFIVYNN